MKVTDLSAVLEGAASAIDLGSLSAARVDQHDLLMLLGRLQREARWVESRLGSRRLSFRKGKPPTRAVLKLLTANTEPSVPRSTSLSLHVGKRPKAAVLTRVAVSSTPKTKKQDKRSSSAVP